MVCLGNICRSPLAHGIMEKMANDQKLNWEIDSAGTSGWHNGGAPDPRSIEVAKKNNLDISRQVSRVLTKADLEYYDYIFAMDKNNLKDIQELAEHDQLKKIHLFLPFGEVEETEEVPDPYYTLGFDHVYDLINRANKTILKKLMLAS